jgi:hypothetical protein
MGHKKMNLAVYVRVSQNPSLATTAASVSADEVLTVLRNKEQSRKAKISGRPFVPAETSENANSVIRAITTGAKRMWGSNEEREEFRRKSDAMCIFHGSPSLFWTFTPNPDGSLLLAFWSGEQLPNGAPSNLDEASADNMPLPTHQMRLVAGDPVLQAQYYWHCVEALIEILFGWDMQKRRPKCTKGILGHVEALFFCEESQGRLTIHHHGVAWIAGMPRTQTEWDNLMNKSRQVCSSCSAAAVPSPARP